MNSVKDKTGLAEKGYRDKLKQDKNEIRLKTKKSRKQNNKVKQFKVDYETHNHQLQNRKKTTKIQKKKQNELNKKRALIRKNSNRIKK